MNIDAFTSLFDFKPALTGHIGVERECFIAKDGRVAPYAKLLLSKLPQGATFGFELSACQLEIRTGPCLRNEIEKELVENDRIATSVAKGLGFSLLHMPVAPSNIPLDVYPDPSGRYAKISANLSEDVLRAACRVAAVHIHIGVSGPADAIARYNRLVSNFATLMSIGNTSDGLRLSLYELMSPTNCPRQYKDWEDYYRAMHARNLLHDPRQCWDMIRISKHGTVEVRVFDSTEDISQIVGWIDAVLA